MKKGTVYSLLQYSWLQYFVCTFQAFFNYLLVFPLTALLPFSDGPKHASHARQQFNYNEGSAFKCLH